MTRPGYESPSIDDRLQVGAATEVHPGIAARVLDPQPAHARLTEGLRDVHAEIGLGTGWTWRPSRLERFGIGLIRLDMVLVGPGVEPVAIDVSCVAAGDHCPVTVRLALVSR